MFLRTVTFDSNSWVHEWYFVVAVTCCDLYLSFFFSTATSLVYSDSCLPGCRVNDSGSDACAVPTRTVERTDHSDTFFGLILTNLFGLRLTYWHRLRSNNRHRWPWWANNLHLWWQDQVAADLHSQCFNCIAVWHCHLASTWRLICQD